jgi:small-conductance mechanosensitive channel
MWRWAALFGMLLLALIVGRVIGFVFQKQAERLADGKRSPVLASFFRSLVGPMTVLMLAGALYFAGTFMFYQHEVAVDPATDEAVSEVEKTFLRERLAEQDFWRNICKAIAVIAAGWFIFKLVDVIEHFLSGWTSKTETTLDDLLVPLVRKALRVFVVIVVGLFLAQNIFHWDIGALIAGLGIGGLAVALAAKDALANFFGSITIFADRPFHLGDRIIVSGNDGMVEEVGFRSTRIRTLMGHQVVLPNSLVVNEPVENIGRRPYLKRVLNVTVTYDTPREKMQQAVAIIRELLDARKEHFAEDLPPKVYFSDFNAASLNIVVYYWFTPPDWWEYLEFNHGFNMELLQRFNEEGIEFAFPTQTLYLKQDSPLEASIASK